MLRAGIRISHSDRYRIFALGKQPAHRDCRQSRHVPSPRYRPRPPPHDHPLLFRAPLLHAPGPRKQQRLHLLPRPRCGRSRSREMTETGLVTTESVERDHRPARTPGHPRFRASDPLRRDRQRVQPGGEAKHGALPGRLRLPAHPGGVRIFKITNCDLKGRTRRSSKVPALRVHRARRGHGRIRFELAQGRRDERRGGPSLRAPPADLGSEPPARRQLAARVDDLERKMNQPNAAHSKNIGTLFDAVRRLMTAPEKPKRQIGFQTKGKGRGVPPSRPSS
jgi:hypothetical protein